MAKMYYNLEETVAKLGCTEDGLKALVREGKLREFRDAGKLNYRVEEVDKLVGRTGGSAPSDSGEMLLEGSGEIPLAPLDEDEGSGARPSGTGGVRELGDSDSDEPIDLSTASGSGSALLSLDGGSDEFKLGDSGGGMAELSLEDSGEAGKADVKLTDSGGGSGIKLEDSGGEAAGLEDSGSGSAAGDIVSLDEVDKDAVEGMKKDDTVITNIGISVFDDDDLEIAADPMAKTLMTGGDEHLGLDGSGGGSGLLDLTRESDDTSLGAELLEGIDMGDTAETVVEAPPQPAGAAAGEEAGPLAEPELEAAMAPMTVQVMVGTTEVASPAFTGLLIAGTLVLALLGAANVATSLNAWPAYLATLSEQFWILLGGSVGLGVVFALVGWLVQMSGSPSRKRAKPRAPKEGKKGKGKKGETAAGGDAPGTAG